MPEPGFVDLIPLFSVCYLHLVELERREVPIRKGVWCETRSLDEADPSPYGSDYVLDSEAWSDATSMTIDWCPVCAQARLTLR